MAFLLYFPLKFIFYCALCHWAIELFQIKLSNTSPSGFAAKWAIGRMMIGFIFGFIIVSLLEGFQTHGWFDGESTALSWVVGYLLSFGVIRVIEWLLVYLLMARIHEFAFKPVSIPALKWVLGGAAVSCVLDIVLLAAGSSFVNQYE